MGFSNRKSNERVWEKKMKNKKLCMVDAMLPSEFQTGLLDVVDLIGISQSDFDEELIGIEERIRKHEREKTIKVILEVKKNLKRGLDLRDYPEHYKQQDKGLMYFCDRLIEYINNPRLVNKSFNDSKVSSLVSVKLKNLESELEQGGEK